MSLGIRRACQADAETLFLWRNDPATRAMCINSDPIAWPGHLDWLGKALANPDRILLIGELDGEPIGTVRLDQENGVSKASWTIAPQARGKGLGAALLTAALAHATTPMVIATIRRDNVASKRIAEKAGFAFVRADGEMERWELQTD